MVEVLADNPQNPTYLVRPEHYLDGASEPYNRGRQARAGHAVAINVSAVNWLPARSGICQTVRFPSVTFSFYRWNNHI
jgi:hypothetical protein